MWRQSSCAGRQELNTFAYVYIIYMNVCRDVFKPLPPAHSWTDSRAAAAAVTTFWQIASILSANGNRGLSGFILFWNNSKKKLYTNVHAYTIRYDAESWKAVLKAEEENFKSAGKFMTTLTWALLIEFTSTTATQQQQRYHILGARIAKNSFVLHATNSECQKLSYFRHTTNNI